MTALRFADMRLRPTEFLDFTSLTLDKFQIGGCKFWIFPKALN